MNGVYRHVKGHEYLVLGVASNSTNGYEGEEFVVYVSLDPEGRTGNPLHVRERHEFDTRFTPAEPREEQP